MRRSPIFALRTGRRQSSRLFRPGVARVQIPRMTTNAASAGHRCFLLRHGESQANVRGLIASDPGNALEAYGLTAGGREQVRRSVLDAQRAGLLDAGGRIISSPLLRARESAAVAADLLGATVHIDVRLTERGFGELELGADDRYAQVWDADRADPSHVRWGVESVESVHRRATAVLHELKSAAGAGAVILCTHGDVASVLLCADSARALSQHRDVGAMTNAEVRELHRRAFPSSAGAVV